MRFHYPTKSRSRNVPRRFLWNGTGGRSEYLKFLILLSHRPLVPAAVGRLILSPFFLVVSDCFPIASALILVIVGGSLSNVKKRRWRGSGMVVASTRLAVLPRLMCY